MRVSRLIGLLILAGGIFAAGFLSAQLTPFSEASPADLPDAEGLPFNTALLKEAWSTLQKHYINSGELSDEELMYGAVSGMVDAVDDPHTQFLTPDDTKKFLENVSGEFEGVGMRIGMRGGQLTVIAPIEGTPADKAGVKAGDTIVEINGTSTSDVTLDEAVTRIRGPKGTTVTLTIFREAWEETREVPIERGAIEIPSMRWEMKDGNVAYIKLHHFSRILDSDFREAAVEIEESNADRIVVDVRNNPGGFLEVSQRVAGWFLPRGSVVAVEEFADGSTEQYRSPGPGRLSDYPVTVLINEGSASASEILAAALRDNAGAQLVGKQSFGKGSVQEVKELSGNASLKVTIARWLTPEGELIEEGGLTPDITVEQDDETEEDDQLQRALEVIQELR